MTAAIEPTISLSTFCRYGLSAQDPAPHQRCKGCDCVCHTDPKAVAPARLVCPHPGCVKTFGPREQRKLASHVWNSHEARLTDYPVGNEIVVSEASDGDSPPPTGEYQWEVFHGRGRTGKVSRRQWSEADRRAVVEEYEAAPLGTKGEVLARHRVAGSMVQRWRAEFGIESAPRGGARPHSGPNGEAEVPAHKMMTREMVDEFVGLRENAEHLDPEAVGRADTRNESPTASPDETTSRLVEEVPDRHDYIVRVEHAQREQLEALAFLEHSDPLSVLAQLVAGVFEALGADPDVADLVRMRRIRTEVSEIAP